MKAFTDFRRAFWLGGVAVVILGFLAAALLLPSTSDPMRSAGPASSVPKMQNVPPDDQRMKLELSGKEQKP